MTASCLVLSWTALYTRGLSPEARAGRLAELESDLWEHRLACGNGLATQVAVLSRCARGIPADLAWRRRAGRSRPTIVGLARGLGWSAFLLGAAWLLLFTGLGAAPLVGLNEHPDWDPTEADAFARSCAVLFAVLGCGLTMLSRLPRCGAALTTLGALATAAYFLWGVVVFGPAALAVTTGAVLLARRRSSST